MSHVLVSEIKPNSVTFRATVHASGGRMSLPQVICEFLEKTPGSTVRIAIQRRDGWLKRSVTLESGTEILAGPDPDLKRVMTPGCQLTVRAHRK
ncbi:MAG: hypothetical protein ACRED8_00305 [Caulobacteraceae bacterium]